MTENMAARGEGLAGLVARWRKDLQTTPIASLATCADELETALEATASANLSVADLKPLKDACDRNWEDESPLQIICIAANAIYWRDVELSVLKGSSDYANGFDAGRESLSTPLTPYGERIADCLRTAVEWNDDYMRINKLYGKVDWVEWAKKLLTGNLEKRAPAATQEPAGSGAAELLRLVWRQYGIKGDIPAETLERIEKFLGEPEIWTGDEELDDHFRRTGLLRGSPRKVGEEGPSAQEIRLGVHLQHCNFGEYPNACKYGDDDCPALTESWSWFGKALERAARPSSVPVGEQKQEEGAENRT